MEKSNLHTIEIKKTWETPAITEIKKTAILGGNDPGNDGNQTATPGSAAPGPVAS